MSENTVPDVREDGHIRASDLRPLLAAMTAARDGDFAKVPAAGRGIVAELSAVFNQIMDRGLRFDAGAQRVERAPVRHGRPDERLGANPGQGARPARTGEVDRVLDALVAPVADATRVLDAVAGGDPARRVGPHDGSRRLRGDLRRLGRAVDTMVDRLSLFTEEVTRVAPEAGAEGQSGGPARVRGVSGVRKDPTGNANLTAPNLTSQVSDLAQVTAAVADDDLSRKTAVDARGEILELQSTISAMVDTLSSFSSEVTRVAREVGSEGQLGAQAGVEGVRGTWKRLTANVSELALDLTTQVRAITEAASAVTRGDMTAAITVAARGEVAELKDSVGVMVSNPRGTTGAKEWLESNLARLAALTQGHRDLTEVADLILRELTPLVNAQYGAFFLAGPEGGAAAHPPVPSKGLAFIAGYGPARGGTVGTGGPPVHGLVRRSAREKKRILAQAPPGYVKADGGPGEAVPATLVILPILFEDKLLGVIELASLSRFSDVHLAFFDQFVNTIGVVINTIIANSRTEALLGESQRLARQLQERSDELQRQQAELRDSNAELEEKAALLATSSQYKSEFLANMSHELRTPLNSLLILARLLSDNADGHLTEQEVQFASTIHRSGSDLLQLINDILDLSKIEAGRMDVRPKRLPLLKVLDYVHAIFRPLTLDRGLGFEVSVEDDAPREMFSDEQRLQQILRNLLSNAIKFTASGRVELRVTRVNDAERRYVHDSDELIAFAVTDTGIGIAPDKLPVIFEAFQQADGTTSRKYGGTGLGLSISREIANLLGGRIVAASEPGVGSTFTLYVPVASPGLAATGPVPGERTGSAFPAPAVREPAAPLYETPDAWPAPAGLEAWERGRAGEVLPGRRVLIVDDDIRNVFALTHVLGRVGMPVLYAENGREGIEALERHPDVQLILMDIMMPEMDGYETIAAVRRSPRWAGLPIVALTAKAMPGDREKSIARGANDYVPKPVDVDRLLTVVCALLDPEGDLPTTADTPSVGPAAQPPPATSE